jgi:hypothetical protein
MLPHQTGIFRRDGTARPGSRSVPIVDEQSLVALFRRTDLDPFFHAIQWRRPKMPVTASTLAGLLNSDVAPPPVIATREPQHTQVRTCGSVTLMRAWRDDAYRRTRLAYLQQRFFLRVCGRTPVQKTRM